MHACPVSMTFSQSTWCKPSWPVAFGRLRTVEFDFVALHVSCGKRCTNFGMYASDHDASLELHHKRTATRNNTFTHVQAFLWLAYCTYMTV